MEHRQTLKEVPSGKIETVYDGAQLLLQFNCSCIDALPYCGGMCCAMRPTFNSYLLPEEVGKGYRELRMAHTDLVFLDYDKQTGRCCEQQENRLCGIWERRPHFCRVVHCSPGGVGEQITIRQAGWILGPTLA